MNSEYYDILGVDKKATSEEINKQRKKLIIRNHPDKVKDPEKKKEAEDKTKQINEAYDVLSNPQKREIYDRFGKEGLSGDGPSSGAGFPGGFPFSSMGDFPFGNLGDMMGKKKKMIQPIKMMVKLTLEQVLLGGKIDENIERFSICKPCDNTGFTDKQKHNCQKCGGSGMCLINKQLGPGMIQRIQQTCQECQGSGFDKKNPNKCAICQGSGITKENFKFSFEIKQGLSKGEQIIIKEKGHEAVLEKNPERGDIIIIIDELEHSSYKRGTDLNGYQDILNLECDITLKLEEALCGFTKTFTYLDGKDYQISSDDIIHNCTYRIIKNYGMFHKNGYKRGDLYLRFIVDQTQHISLEKKKLIHKLLTGKDLDLDKIYERPDNHREMYDLSDHNMDEHHVYESDDDSQETVNCTHQ